MISPFTQTLEYLSWQENIGTKTYYKEFIGYANGLGFTQIAAAAVILNTKAGRILYFPYGPVLSETVNPEVQKEFKKWVKQILNDEQCLFARFENNNQGLVASKNFIQNFYSPPTRSYSNEGIFQPRLEWVLDISRTTENLHENFTKDCRYSIRRSEKEIEVGNAKVEMVRENLRLYSHEFIALMSETSERNGFLSHEDKYYQSVFNSLDSKKINGYLVIGKVKREDDEWVTNAMAVVIIDTGDERANYVYGGSRNFKRELGVSYKVQWEAIKLAKELGCNFYNFGGITGTVNGKRFGRETLLGVTNFKKQFGGQESFNGYFYDLSAQKLKYLLYILYKLFR